MHNTDFPQHWQLQPLYLDDQLLIVQKPANTLSVPGRGLDKQDCLISRIQQTLPDALTVHRLDYATSGLMVFARGKDAQRALSQRFERRQVHKRYIAVVTGLLTQAEGEVDLPLICDWPNRPLQKVDYQQGKAALTRYQRLSTDPTRDTSRVLLTPVTGRSHQLRVHMQQLGHPILGDEFYAPEPVRAQSPRLLLHANWLSFAHPVTDAIIEVSCEPEF